MQKSFEIKIYQLNGTFKGNLKWSEIVRDFSFSQQINGGQGEATAELNKSFENATYSQGDFGKVTVFTDDNPNGLLIYTGIINKIERKYTDGIETIALKFLGLSSVLSLFPFYSASYTPNKNQDPAQTIKDIIDYANTKYNWFSYSGGNIVNYGSNLNIDFNYTKCFDAIKNTVQPFARWWRIDADGQVYFQAVPGTATHKLTAWKDIEAITVSEDAERIVNSIIVVYKTGTLATVQDATSISTYGLREIKVEKTDLADSTAATNYANSYIASYKDPKKKTTITVNTAYNLESLKPGDTVKVQNFLYSISNLQIQKISYTWDNVVIELDAFDTFAKEVFS